MNKFKKISSKKEISQKPILINKKATFDYQILDKFVAGVALSGGLVKQIVNKKINLTGKFVIFQKGRLEIVGFGNELISQNVPLLLTKKEIRKIQGQLSIKGVTCIILSIKRQKRWLKAEIALVKGKKEFEKKESIKNREIDREIKRDYGV
jgi:SsrA-binding protein